MCLHECAPSGEAVAAIVLNHGTFSNYRSVRGLAGYLSEQGYHCWILDCQGHGYSDKPVEHPDFETMYLQDAAAALDFVQARCKKPVWWVGHSGGGLAILMLLARHPQRQSELAGVVTIASQATDAGKGLVRRLCWSSAIVVTKVLGFAPGRIFRVGPENEFGAVMRQWFRWSLAGQWHGSDGFDYLLHLKTITLPSLTIAGAGDLVIAPVDGVRKIHQKIGSNDKSFSFASRDNGFLEDYNHARVVSSRNASREVWPLVADWISRRNQSG